jgi:hypothetical protein
MALLPPIPDRPADRPETWAEYLSRRAIVAMHRQFADELAAFVIDAPPFTVGDVVKSFGRFAEAYQFNPKPVFIDMAGNRVPFTKTKGQPLPLAYGSKRTPVNILFTVRVTSSSQPQTVLIDEDVTWRDGAVRRLLADPSATDLFFTDGGVLQATNVGATPLHQLCPRPRRQTCTRLPQHHDEPMLSLHFSDPPGAAPACRAGVRHHPSRLPARHLQWWRADRAWRQYYSDRRSVKARGGAVGRAAPSHQ